MKKIGFTILLCALLLALLSQAPDWADKTYNASPAITAPKLALHDDLFIADLHSDALLWPRDLLQRHQQGHVDQPRMQSGNVALQVFSAVTHSPFGQNFHGNSGDSNRVIPLVMAQGWPIKTWSSALQRALYQADRLKQAAADSNGTLRLIQNRADLFSLHLDRIYQPNISGALLAIEGAQALDGDANNLDALYNAGYRMIGLTHFFDNTFGGSAHGLEQYGLTEEGKMLLQKMAEKKMLIDLAHASPALIDDVLRYSSAPLFVSHSGVKGTCNSPRNLSDEQLRNIAARGGIIGIAFFPGAICGPSVQHITDALLYAVKIAGVNAVGLGSDFDGAVSTPFDAAGLSALTQSLVRAGLSEADIRKIMGENILRVFSKVLPPNPHLNSSFEIDSDFTF